MLAERMVIGVLVLVGALLMVTVARCGVGGTGPVRDNARIVRPNDSAPAGPSSGSAVQPATAQPQGAGTLYAGDQLVLPMAQADLVGPHGDLSAYSGRAVGTDLLVLSVPADEGFWVGDSRQDRVWVELTGRPRESPYDVDRYDHVSFTGRLVRNRPGFARSIRVTDREGRDLLDAERQHVAVRKDELRLSS